MTENEQLTFRGPGPFHLPVVQSAIVTGNTNNGVTMMLYAILPGRGSKPESVCAQMLSSVARELAVSLLQAADKADGDRSST